MLIIALFIIIMVMAVIFKTIILHCVLILSQVLQKHFLYITLLNSHCCSLFDLGVQIWGTCPRLINKSKVESEFEPKVSVTSKIYTLTIYHVPKTVLSVLNRHPPVTLIANLGNRHHYHLHFTDTKTGARKLTSSSKFLGVTSTESWL